MTSNTSIIAYNEKNRIVAIKSIEKSYFMNLMKSPCSEERVGENRGLINIILDIPAQDVFLHNSADMNTKYNTFYEFNDFFEFRDRVVIHHARRS
jgi:hypothetical protein